MEEDQQTDNDGLVKNPVAMYFWRARNLAMIEDEYLGVSQEIRDLYQNEVKLTYDLLYDRIMATDISHFLKQEVEQWYGFNRDFLGFMRTSELNQELEGMLARFNLI
jgi:hypothetical protein